MQFHLRTLFIIVTLLCVGFGLVAAFPEAAIGLIYPLLYPLAIFVMALLSAGMLVLGELLTGKCRKRDS